MILAGGILIIVITIVVFLYVRADVKKRNP